MTVEVKSGQIWRHVSGAPGNAAWKYRIVGVGKKFVTLESLVTGLRTRAMHGRFSGAPGGYEFLGTTP